MKLIRKALLLGVLFSVLFMLGLSVDGVTLDLDQQGQWDLIETRLNFGYRNWSELIDWAERENIEWKIYENNAPITPEMFDKVQKYGILGQYIRTTPGISLEDEEKVILIFHWAEVRYDIVMESLYNLERSSDEITEWLTRENLGRLEEQFVVVNLLEIDENGDLIYNDPFQKEFIAWDLSFTPLLSREESILTIVLQYQVTSRPSREEMQQILQEILDELENNETFTGLGGNR